MGGHGALTIFLANPTRYRSVSAFSPICNPIAVPWGQKAFAGEGAPSPAQRPPSPAQAQRPSFAQPLVTSCADQLEVCCACAS